MTRHTTTNVERIPFSSRAETGSMGGTRERHESFGLVGVSRISHAGRNRMFGTHLDQHPTTFRFTVKRAVRYHSQLAYDSYFHDHEAAPVELVEFEMTATQFVELLTSLNVGEGVPCTLRYVMGTRMEDVPEEHKSEHEVIRNTFKRDMLNVAKSAKPATDQIDAILDKKTIGKGDRDEIRGLVRSIVKQFDDHAPFVMRQFTEATTRMETAGKAEVEAYAQQVIRAAGLEYLRQLKDMEPAQVEAQLEAMGVRPPLQLGEGFARGIHECPKSPDLVCWYNEDTDPGYHDQCIYCGEPEERK